MYKLMASHSCVTPLISVTLIIIAFNRQLLNAGANTTTTDDCSLILKNHNLDHNVLNTTNQKNTQTNPTNISNIKTNNKLTNDLYKQYSDCLKSRYERQRAHRPLHSTNKKSSDDVIDDGMRFKRDRRSVLDGEGMRFKKDPILDEEGMRFKKDSLLDEEGMRFKKSVLDGEGMRFRKNDRILDDEGMRFKKSVLDGEGMRFKKDSLLDEEGMRFKKASVLDGEGMRFKKDSMLDDEGMRFRKSVLDGEGMRFKKESLLDQEGMRFKKASVLDGEGMRFKKASVLDGEGMRFKKLMANQLHRLRKFNFRPFKVLDETSAERSDGGSSSDILEGEGMRFKRGPSSSASTSSDSQAAYNELISKYYAPKDGTDLTSNYLTHNNRLGYHKNSHNPKNNSFWNRIQQIYLVYDK